MAADHVCLGPRAREAGHTLSILDTVGSTNTEALSRDAGGAAHWVVARQQTAGRGRQGRQWSSPPGNLHATLLLIDPCEPRHAAKLGFVAGVCLVAAIASIHPRLRGLRLKWPNDCLINGAKGAGILLEARMATGAQPASVIAVAVGIGVNLAFHPEDAPYRTTSLTAEGYQASVADMLPALSDVFVDRLAVFARGAGFGRIRDEWLSLAHGVGEFIEVRLEGDTLRGRFEGIDTDGRLILGHAGGHRSIDAGDVYFPTLTAQKTASSNDFRLDI